MQNYTYIMRYEYGDRWSGTTLVDDLIKLQPGYVDPNQTQTGGSGGSSGSSGTILTTQVYIVGIGWVTVKI